MGIESFSAVQLQETIQNIRFSLRRSTFWMIGVIGAGVPAFNLLGYLFEHTSGDATVEPITRIAGVGIALLGLGGMVSELLSAKQKIGHFRNKEDVLRSSARAYGTTYLLPDAILAQIVVEDAPSPEQPS